MKTLMFIMFFLLIGAFFIVSRENLALNSKENIVNFFESYLSWILKLTENSKVVSAYVVKMQWLPDMS